MSLPAIIATAGVLAIGFLFIKRENNQWSGKDMAIHNNERYTNPKHQDYINSSTSQPQWIPHEFIRNLRKSRFALEGATGIGSILGIPHAIKMSSSLHAKYSGRYR